MVRNIILLYILGIWTVFVEIAVTHKAIINGELADVDQFPYQVSLQYSTGKHFCGAGVISEQFIISAAHCFLRDNDNIVNRTILVVAGTNDLHEKKKPAVTIEIEKVSVPKEFTLKNLAYVADIAVAKLKHPLQLSEHIKKLQLPKNKHELFYGKTAIVAGFGWHWKLEKDGKVHRGGHHDSHLRFSQVDTFGSMNATGLINAKVPENYIYVKMKQPDHSKPRGICMGDSGSPLVHGNTVIGIASKAGPICSELTMGAIYASVAHYLDIVENAMQEKPNKYMRTYIMQHNND